MSIHKYSINIILCIVFFSYTKLIFASELYLPEPTGPYSVGTKAIEISDPSRNLFRESLPRRWMVQAFYPSQPHEGVYPYMPGTLKDGVVQGTKVFTSAKPNAAPIEAAVAAVQRFPVIIFIPGLGGERQKYTILCEELAGQGYVVLALDLPYVTNFVQFPDGTKIVPTLTDVWKVPRDRDYRYQYYDDAMAGAIQDVAYLLDHLNDINTHELGDIINSQEIILMGHSFGGNVAHTLGFQDPRVKAVVDIDSKITERAIFGHIGVPPNPTGKPVLFIRGMMQYQEEGVNDQLAKISNSTIWAPQVQHSAFSDQAYFANKLQSFGNQKWTSNFLNWLLKTGPHWDRIDTNLGDKSAEAWFAEYPDYIVEWMKSS